MPETFDRLELREAEDFDEQFLFRLYCDVRGPEVAAWGWPAAQNEAFLRMQFDAQRRSYRAADTKARDQIVVMEGVPIGRRLVALAPGEMRLVDIALLSSYRNRGIGSELIRELIVDCCAKEVVLRIHVFQGNPALRLYHRMGFVETGNDPMYIQMAWSPGQTKIA